MKKISVSPDPPERGQDLTITVEGVADAAVEVRAMTLQRSLPADVDHAYRMARTQM